LIFGALEKTMAGVIGLGGVFFKAKDPQKLTTWYQTHLNLPPSEPDNPGLSLPLAEADVGGYQVWSPFRESTDYFQPSESRYMINFRVDDLAALVEQLERAGIEILGFEDEPYGKFAWIVDPEGTKIELWQPV
jgi:predicted enzyme related to lactoylglutathione lyase